MHVELALLRNDALKLWHTLLNRSVPDEGLSSEEPLAILALNERLEVGDKRAVGNLNSKV